MHRVFIYGTLKRGQRNHAFLKSARFIGEARTAAAVYSMRCAVDTAAGYPYPAVMDGGAGFISGDVYDGVDDALLARLDDLEELGTEYRRDMVDLSDGTQAWIYLWIGPDEVLRDVRPEIRYDNEHKTYIWC
ncbi:MAG: gamma-glutamylcyclotransferase [Alphaproteobacteria bacterium]|nr:gamma-glutamylcyclotransferase [Alphaproteobacteria bacterium]